MIPLFVLAIVLSAAALAAEKSPRLRTRPHRVRAARALEDASVAHRACAVHLDAARAASDPATAVEHAQAAAVANQVAAQKVATVAEAAATEEQRVAAAQGAAAVVDRQHEIAGTLVDAHLDAASSAPDPMTAAEHVHEATKVNQATAQQTADAAKAATDAAQRAEAAKSAAKVVERDNKITVAMARLGVGQCEVHTYKNITPQVRDKLLAKLRAAGMTVTGDNPYAIDTHQHDVKLRAVWDPAAQLVKVIVTAGADGLSNFLVCPAVWERIDPIMKEILK